MTDVLKRDGRRENWAKSKIDRAVKKCLMNNLGAKEFDASSVAHQIADSVERIVCNGPELVEVEEVQRLVIQQLWASNHCEAAEQYTIHRERRKKERAASPISYEEQKRIEDDAAHFPSPLQYYQFLSKFARWREQDSRRETWRETCDRVMDWFWSIPQIAATLTREERQALDKSLYEMRATCAMRVIQMAGPALDRCNVGCFNCAWLPIVDLFSFSELLYILMQGTGVGFSVESDFIDKLPKVKKQKGKSRDKFVVPDSTEGWCDALKEGLSAWFGGEDVDFDFSHVRTAGAKLKTKGGLASGPKPLMDLLAFARRLVLAKQGNRLDDLDVHDLCCMIGKIVQVGGVRRASCISLSDLDSVKMRDAKSGNWYEQHVYRTMANNSAVFETRPTDEEFMAEWLSLCKAKTGERGIFNRYAITKNRPARRAKAVFGGNPCQPGCATLLTPSGIRTMDDVKRGDLIWSGEQWTEVVAKKFTGVEPVFRYETTAGVFIGTSCHKVFSHGERVAAGDADSIDVAAGGLDCPENDWDKQDVVDGWVIGDGTIHKASNNLVLLCLGEGDGEFHSELAEFVRRHRSGISLSHWEVTTSVVADELPRTWSRRVPARFLNGHGKKVASFLRGLYAANGSVCGNRVTLKSTSRLLIEDVQSMLSAVGIRSYFTTNKPTIVKWANGSYVSKQSYDLNVSSDRDKFRDLIGFVHCRKADKLNAACGVSKKDGKRTFEVTNTTSLGKMPVWDITVKAEEHSYWTGGLLVSNCGEVILRANEFCNLSIAVGRPADTVDTLRDKVTCATYFGVMQSLCTNFNYIRPEWKKNCDEERLLGVDITGHADCPLLRFGAPGRAELLTELRKQVAKTRSELAKRFGINDSAADTCVKPGGNSAVFFDCASGVSPRFSDWQWRWVRESVTSPMAKFLIDEGVPHTEAPEDRSLLVFGFPKHNPEGSTKRNDMTAIQQLENWMEWKTCWAEHAVSTTVYVRDDEWMKSGCWVLDHFGEISGGLAFLPKDNTFYSYAPNEEITREQYEEAIAKFPKINWAKLRRYETGETQPNLEYCCVGGSCEV